MFTGMPFTLVWHEVQSQHHPSDRGPADLIQACLAWQHHSERLTHLKINHRPPDRPPEQYFREECRMDLHSGRCMHSHVHNLLSYSVISKEDPGANNVHCRVTLLLRQGDSTARPCKHETQTMTCAGIMHGGTHPAAHLLCAHACQQILA